MSWVQINCWCSLQTAAGALRRLSEFHWGANLANFERQLVNERLHSLATGRSWIVKMRSRHSNSECVRAQNESAFEGTFLTTISPRCKFSCLAIPSATWLELLQSTFLCTWMTCNWAIQILVNKFPVASTSHADVLLSSHSPNCTAGPYGIQLLVTAVPSHQARVHRLAIYMGSPSLTCGIAFICGGLAVTKDQALAEKLQLPSCHWS
jgi:hypothetical protein